MRIFTDQNNISENIIRISGEDVQHMQVLRMRPGDSLTVCDGRKNDYACVIETITKSEAVLKIESHRANSAEPDVLVTLFQSVAKGDKMDWIVQKCVELGVFEIVPVYTRYSVPKNKNDKSGRLQKISESAAKQSGRGIVPHIARAVTLEEALLTSGFDALIAAYELEKTTTMKSIFKSGENTRKIGLFIGPEGGFSKEEADLLRSSGALSVSLGNRILRTETAAVCALSIINYCLEWK